MQTVLLNDFKRQWSEIGEEVRHAVEAVGASGWYVLGAQVAGFEQDLAQFWGLANAVGVGSGLDALEIGLRALGLRCGDRVLTTPLSAFATTMAIVRLGGVPVFCDTDAKGLLDLEQAEAVLAADPGIRFLLPVHLFGQSLDLDRLAALRDRCGVAIVEDCAQSIGGAWSGRPTGSVGRLAATSFYPTKNLGALGEGGAVLTGDAELAARVRRLRDYGQSAKYRHDEIGWNSRLDELQAAILRGAMLPRLREWTRRRQQVAAAYSAGMRHAGVRLLRPTDGEASCEHLFPVTVAPERREQFEAHLKSRGIATGRHYPILIPDQQALAGVRVERHGELAVARRLAASEVSLPIHPQLTGEEVERVIAAVNEWPAEGPTED
ncbi:MAG: DegT/DnrJ/EryC1/StrS family aminotransferase [Acidobacteria bacterium]|nr:DegT/DnrJ/EryC1/StrS family aminotransferase [Acidobacteriota bacterium]